MERAQIEATRRHDAISHLKPPKRRKIAGEISWHALALSRVADDFGEFLKL